MIGEREMHAGCRLSEERRSGVERRMVDRCSEAPESSTPSVFQPGERNTQLTSIAGRLRASGLDAPANEALLTIANLESLRKFTAKDLFCRAKVRQE